MKKIIAVVLAMLFILTSFSAFADSDITLTLNGEVLNSDVAPVIVNDRTMVPFRAIFEALNIEVNWSDALRKVYATSDGVTVILTVDSTKMLVNDEMITLEAAPFIMNDRVLVPVRAVCEALKCTVDWDGANRIVKIKTAGYVEPSYTETIGGDPAYIKKEHEFDKELLELVNKERASLGLGSLSLDTMLSSVAAAHSEDMAERDYIDHTNPDGVGPFDRIDAAGISYVSAAENIASGFATAEKVFNSWMNSEKHKANLVNPEFGKIGIGYYAGGTNGTYWTVVLISD